MSPGPAAADAGGSSWQPRTEAAAEAAVEAAAEAGADSRADPGQRRGRGYALGDSAVPLVDAYDAVLYDLDGVLYLGGEAVPHAAAAVVAAIRAGLRAAYVTNNASRRPATVAAHLAELGIPAVADDVVTSAQAVVRLLAERLPAGAQVLVVGAPGLVEEVAGAGFEPVRAAGDQVCAVVQGYGPDTGYRELAEACIAIRAGAVWIAANTDSTLPSPRGPLPGNGALVAALRVATGREPLVAGKPEPALHRESVTRVGASRPLVVGDRLDTDVLGAIRGDADSLLVLTGITDLLGAVTAPAGMRPTYVARDLRGLLEPQPAVVVSPDGEQARCGVGRAALEKGVVHLVGEDDTTVRAACALGWRSADAGRPVTAVVDG